jgi:hypothetical protein
MSIPYTYLIGWSDHNLWYYGVRYAKTCNPNDLWVTYFTSSKKVREYREQFGEPNIRQIRKVFSTTKSAKVWEDKVLARLKVCNNPKWINQSNNYSFASVDKSWNDGLTKNTDNRLQNISNKISAKRKEKYWKSGDYIRSTDQVIKNRMFQITRNNPNFIFETYDLFAEYCNKEYVSGKSITDISKSVNVGMVTVKLAIEHQTGDMPIIDQSWSKLKKNNPELPFDDYKDLCDYLYSEILIKGRKRFHLRKELNISEDAIRRAIRVSEATRCL